MSVPVLATFMLVFVNLFSFYAYTPVLKNNNNKSLQASQRAQRKAI